jgi:hypothetical protein
MAVAADKPRVVRVTVPGIQGPQGPTGPAGSLELSGQINNSSDIDVSALADGAILQYSSNSVKWVARNDTNTGTGTLKLNGGTY